MLSRSCVSRRDGLARIERAPSAPGRRLALLFVDTDHFKEFNDTHGHSAGDVLLRRLAALLQESAAPGDIVARNGGDDACLGTNQMVLANELPDAVDHCRHGTACGAGGRTRTADLALMRRSL